MSGTSGVVQSFCFPPPDGAASCTINETFKVLNWQVYIMVPSFCITVLKGDSIVGHHIGLNWMHPDGSSYLNMSAKAQMGWQISGYSCLDKNCVLSFLKCMDGSVLAFLKCMDGAVFAFLNCMNGSIWTHLNGTYGSVWSHIRCPA